MSLENLEQRLHEEREKRGESVSVKRATKRLPRMPRALARYGNETGKKKSGHSSWFRWVMVGIVSLLILGGGVAFVLLGISDGGNVAVVISVPSGIFRGVPFDLEVNVENQLDTAIRDAAIVLNLPADLIYAGNLGTDRAVVRESVGDIGAQTVSRKTFKLIATGSPDSAAKVGATLSYGTSGQSRFQTSAAKEITVSGAAVKISVKGPEKIIAGSAFEMEINYENLSSFSFPETALRVQYPDGFRFQSASMSPDSLDNYWRLGALRTNSKGVLRVKGVFTDAPTEKITMAVTFMANFSGEEYPIAEENAELSLSPAPLALHVFVNGRDDYVARAGDVLTYTIPYKNDSGIALADVTIRLTLAGELFDIASVSTDAAVDSAANELTWNAGNVPTFRLLDPGASGEVRATINLKSSFPIRRLSDKNFMLKVQARADSPSVPYYLTADRTTAFASAETKVAGLVVVDAQTFFRDTAAMVLNQGGLPPKVGQATEYTIHWVLKNYGTDVRNVEVRGVLPANVAWTGQVKSSVDAVPTWNEETREVVWKLERVTANKGVISSPLEAVFQVRAAPDAGQTGQYQPLMGETTLVATDEFTGLTLTNRDAGLTTALPDDRTVGEGMGRVVP